MFYYGLLVVNSSLAIVLVWSISPESLMLTSHLMGWLWSGHTMLLEIHHCFKNVLDMLHVPQIHQNLSNKVY